MIRIAILGDTHERSQNLAEALAETDRVEVIEARAIGEELNGGREREINVTVVVGLSADEIGGIKTPLVVVTDAPVPEGFGRTARAWLPLSSSVAEIEAAISAVAQRLVVLTREQSQRWLRTETHENEAVYVEALTARELEVLRMMADGLGNKEIAGSLNISEHTAKFHVSQILGKLGVNSRAEAVAKGIRRGLVPI